jgi:hypothetical protein
MKLKIITTLLFCLSLTGCATLEKWHQDWLRENCTPMVAYNNGLTDGLRPGQMPSNYANQCPTNQEEIGRSYLRGFREGLAARPQQININKEVTTKEDKKN